MKKVLLIIICFLLSCAEPEYDGLIVKDKGGNYYMLENDACGDYCSYTIRFLGKDIEKGW